MVDHKPIAPSAHPLWVIVRSAVQSSFLPIVDQATVSASNFLTNVVIARQLGAYDFGVFTLAWSMVLLGLSFQLTLITSPMYTLAGRRRGEQENSYYSALTAIQAAYCGCVFALVYAAAHFAGGVLSREPVDSYAVPLGAVAASYLWQDFVRRCLFSRGRTAAAFLIDIVSYPLQLAVLLLFISGNRLDLEATLWIITATSACSALIGLLAAPPDRLRLADIVLVAKEHWAFGRWIVGSIATNWVVLNLFYLVAGFALGAPAVAGLRAVALLFAVGNVFFLGLENFVPVKASQLLARDGGRAFLSYMRFWLGVGIGASVAISASLGLLAWFWLHLVFGGIFDEYTGVLYVSAIAYPISCYVSLGGVLLRCAAATKPIFMVWAAMALFALVVAYPATSYLGVYGAAVGQLGCYLLGWLLTHRSIRRLTAAIQSPAQ